LLGHGRRHDSPRGAEPPSPCGAIDEIKQVLDQSFAERPVAVGLQEEGTLLNVFASEMGETFTVVIASPDGMGCIVAGGTDWQSLAPVDRVAHAGALYPAPRHRAADGLARGHNAPLR
jgi:hypothetical protein